MKLCLDTLHRQLRQTHCTITVVDDFERVYRDGLTLLPLPNSVEVGICTVW